MIAIIAILASLLLPALNRALGKARAISCLSQLNQVMKGAQMYIDDNQGYLVMSLTVGNSYEPWTTVLARRISNANSSIVYPQYIKSKLLICPETYTENQTVENFYGTYGMYRYDQDSDYLSNRDYNSCGINKKDRFGAIGQNLGGRRLVIKGIRIPLSQFAVFADTAVWESSIIKYHKSSSWTYSPSEWSNNGGVWLGHSNRANLAFGDGHAAAMSSYDMYKSPMVIRRQVSRFFEKINY